MKRYLGDGVYVQTDGWMLILTTEDGIKTTNAIYLDPSVYQALLKYVDDMFKTVREAASEG